MKEKAEPKEYINVVTPKFRVSFPHLFEAKGAIVNGKETEPRFSLTMLFKKDTDLSKLKAAVKKACIEKWGDDETEWPDNLMLPWRDGDEEEKFDGYKGHISAKADSKKQPGVVDKNKDDIFDKNEVYAGCFCRASVSVSAYALPGKRGAAGVKFYLQSVQKLDEGPRFGRSAKDDFDDYEDDESSDDDTSDMGF